jgi:hypothetical protein
LPATGLVYDFAFVPSDESLGCHQSPSGLCFGGIFGSQLARRMNAHSIELPWKGTASAVPSSAGEVIGFSRRGIVLSNRTKIAVFDVSRARSRSRRRHLDPRSSAAKWF